MSDANVDLHSEMEVGTRLPESFRIGEAAGRGECFFDSVAQGLNAVQWKGSVERFTSKSLRLLCKAFAEQHDPPQWFVKHVQRTHSLTDYASTIQTTAAEARREEEREKLQSVGASESWQHRVVEGRPEVEGRIICTKYGVKLHCIEKQIVENATVWCHDIVDETGSRSETPIDYTDDTTLHIINLRSHFKPILRHHLEECLQQNLQYQTDVCEAQSMNSDGNLHKLNVIFPAHRSEDADRPSLESRLDTDASKNFRQKLYFDLRNLFEMEKNRNGGLRDADDPSQSYSLEDFYEDYFSGDTSPIIAACKYDQVAILDHALSCDYPAKSMDTDRDGSTAFHYAIYSGSTKLLQKLLRRWQTWPFDVVAALQIQSTDDILDLFCQELSFDRTKIPEEMQVFLKEQLNWRNYLLNIVKMIRSHNNLTTKTADSNSAASPEAVVAQLLAAIDFYTNTGEKQSGSSVYRYRFFVLSLVAEHFQMLVDQGPARVPPSLLREQEICLYQLLLPFIDHHRMILLRETLRNYKSNLLQNGRRYENVKDTVQECSRQQEEMQSWFADGTFEESEKDLLIRFRGSMVTLAEKLKDGKWEHSERPRTGPLVWLQAVPILDALSQYVQLSRSVDSSELQIGNCVVERMLQVLNEFSRFTKKHQQMKDLKDALNLRHLTEMSNAKSGRGRDELESVRDVQQNLKKIKEEVDQISQSVQMEGIKALVREMQKKNEEMECERPIRDRVRTRLSVVEQAATLDAMTEPLMDTVQLVRQEEQFHQIRLTIQTILQSVKFHKIRTKVETLVNAWPEMPDEPDLDRFEDPTRVCARLVTPNSRPEGKATETRLMRPDEERPLPCTGGVESAGPKSKSELRKFRDVANIILDDICRRGNGDSLFGETIKHLKDIQEAEHLIIHEKDEKKWHAILEMLVFKALDVLRHSSTVATHQKVETLMKTSVKRLHASCHWPLDSSLMDVLGHPPMIAARLDVESKNAIVRHCAALLVEEGESLLAIKNVLEMQGGGNFLLHDLQTKDLGVNLSRKMTTKYQPFLKAAAKKSRYWQNEEWKGDAVAVLRGSTYPDTVPGSDDAWRFVCHHLLQRELFDAVSADRLETVSWCLRHGADLSDGRARSALHLATVAGHQLVVSYLLSKGADVDSGDGHGNTPLHLAALEGNSEVMQILLNRSARVDAANGQHFTALHVAAVRGHSAAARLLVENGAGIESATDDGFTPLFLALAHPEVVKVLLENGANVNARTKANATPLHEAARRCHDGSLRLLLSGGGNLRALDDGYGTPLHGAVVGGHVAAVRTLLDHGATVDEVCRSKWTLLHHAAAEGHPEICRILLERGGSVRTVDDDGARPLHVAARHGHLEIVRLLLDGGADPEAPTAARWKPIHCAVSSGHLHVVQFLLDRGANANAADGKQRTPLHHAALRHSGDITRALLEHGAKASVVDYKRQTALHLAGKKGDVQIARQLLEHKVALDVEDRKGRTAIERAAKRGHRPFCQLLMDGGQTLDAQELDRLLQRNRQPAKTSTDGRGPAPRPRPTSSQVEKFAEHMVAQSVGVVEARLSGGTDRLHRAVRDGRHGDVCRLVDGAHSVDVLDRQHWAPIHIAAAQNDTKIIAALLDGGANVDVRGRWNLTPLHLAAHLGNEDAIESLLERGADFRATCSSWTNRTALHLAADRRHVGVVRTLVAKGANVDAADDDGNTPLHLADVETAAALIEMGATVERTNACGQTALHVAALGGHRSLVHLFVERGSPLDARDAEGRTPLYLAVWRGHGPIVTGLASRGANVDVPNVEGCTPLHVAARHDDPDVLRQLLANGASVDRSDGDGRTALHEAASIGHDVNVRRILEEAADVDAVDRTGRTALHLATRCGHRPTVCRLLERGADVDGRDRRDLTPLFVAIQSGNVAVCRLLIVKGADVDAYSRKLDATPLYAAISSQQPQMVTALLQNGARINGRNADGITPLRHAAFVGNADIAELLLRHGAAVDAGDKQNNAPLHVAAREGHLRTAEVLLSHGANPNVFGDTNKTPLRDALQRGHSDVVALLLRNGASIDTPHDDRFSPLHGAVLNADARSVDVLLQHGADPNLADDGYGNTPLHLATSHGHADIVRLLIRKRADVDAIDGKLATPLHLAAEAGRLDIVRLLLNNGANPESRDEDGLTALHVAAKHDESGRVVDALLAFDAEIDASDDGDRCTPLHVACRFGHAGAVATLLENGADVNATDRARSTPLHVASGRGHRRILDMLLHYGADVRAADAEGLTALHEAAREGHVDVVHALVGRGADVRAATRVSSWTPLHLAAHQGHDRVVAGLLREDESVDAVLDGGSTPLYLAAYRGHSKVVETLLGRGASVRPHDADRNVLHAAVHGGNAQTLLLILNEIDKESGRGWDGPLEAGDDDGDTPLTLAAKLGRATPAAILLQRGARQDTKNKMGRTALHWAAHNGHHHILEMLLGSSPPVPMDERDDAGDTPLHVACRQGHLEAANVLVANGADVDSRNAAHLGALHTAAENGLVEIVEILLRSGAQMDACDDADRCTPLHLAAIEGHSDVVQALLEKGARADPLLSNGFSPLYLAAQNGHEEAVRALLEGGASPLGGHGPSTVLHAAVCSKIPDVVSTILLDINKRESFASSAIDAPDDAGDTPLMWAAEGGMSKVARLLLGIGANVHLTNKKGMTALHWAAKNGHHQVVKLLLRYRADRKMADGEGKRPIEHAVIGLDRGHDSSDDYQKTIKLLRVLE